MIRLRLRAQELCFIFVLREDKSRLQHLSISCVLVECQQNTTLSVHAWPGDSVRAKRESILVNVKWVMMND